MSESVMLLWFLLAATTREPLAQVLLATGDGHAGMTYTVDKSYAVDTEDFVYVFANASVAIKDIADSGETLWLRLRIPRDGAAPSGGFEGGLWKLTALRPCHERGIVRGGTAKLETGGEGGVWTIEIESEGREWNCEAPDGRQEPVTLKLRGSVVRRTGTQARKELWEQVRGKFPELIHWHDDLYEPGW